jgi:hypothetical protein
MDRIIEATNNNIGSLEKMIKSQEEQTKNH